MTTLYDYWTGLDANGKRSYAERAGTTVDYIRIHLVPPKGSKRKLRTPRRELMHKLASASDGQVSYGAVVGHFFGERPEQRPEPNNGYEAA